MTELLKTGVIRPNSNPFSSLVFLVREFDGSWHLCVDYQALNQETVKDKFLTPVIDKVLDELYGDEEFSKLDLRSEYNQIQVVLEDIPKIVFCTHEGNYEFLVMPFGILNAFSTFQGLMNAIFKLFLRMFFLVFFYDILVYSRNWDTHIEHVRQVLEILSHHTLFARRSKCHFGVTKVEYLEYIVIGKGVKADPKKVALIVEWPTPKDTKSLQGFLGFDGVLLQVYM